MDEQDSRDDTLEEEANAWTYTALVSLREYRAFVEERSRSVALVGSFAERQGIAPGTIVGVLQHQSLLPGSHLNERKVKLKRLAKDRQPRT